MENLLSHSPKDRRQEQEQWAGAGAVGRRRRQDPRRSFSPDVCSCRLLLPPASCPLASTIPCCITVDCPDRAAAGLNRRTRKASVLVLGDKLDTRLIPGDVKISGCSGTDRRVVELVRTPIIAVDRREIEMANLPSGIIHHTECQRRRGGGGQWCQRGKRAEHGDQHQQAKVNPGVQKCITKVSH